MIALQLQRARNVLLARYTGDFSPATVEEMDTASAQFFAAYGPFDYIGDFSGVEGIRMPVNYVRTRAERPQLCPGRARLYIAPQPELRAILALFGTAQLLVAARRPEIVDSLDDALNRLGCRLEDFEPLKL